MTMLEGAWAMLVLVLLTYILVWAGERGGRLPVAACGALGLASVVGWVLAISVAGSAVVP